MPAKKKKKKKKVQKPFANMVWSPQTFKRVVALTSRAPEPIREQLIRAVEVVGLSCPAPPWDTGGVYRVGLNNVGGLQIQKLDVASSEWAEAKLEPPEP